MATTVRLVPSAYSLGSNISVSSVTNAYKNTDTSSSYATFQTTSNSTSNRYCYLKGFNLGTVPNNAIVSSITVKIRGYESGASTSTSYAPCLVNNTTAISSTTASSNFGTSDNTITIPIGNLTWSDITDYGSDFGIRFNARRNSRNTVSYVYISGAEIEVTYTLPVYHTITSSTSAGTIDPSGATSVLEGDSYTLLMNVTNPVVKDNNIDVTSQIIKITGGTDTFIPYDNTSSGFSISNINNAYTDISGSTYADCSLAGRTTGTLYLDLGPINLPSSATITSISCQASLQISRNGSNSSMTASCQMYSGNTAKGSATTLVSSAQDVARTTYTLSIGSWTASELQNARFYITMYNGASSTVRHIYVYGVSFVISYTVSGEVYTYTITNVTADHTIVVTQGQLTAKIYLKKNGTWTQYSKVYKKISGSWVEQSDPSSIFDTTANYVNADN